MGITHLVTLRIPAHRLRTVNLAVDKSAWGSSSTKFYAIYGFHPVWSAKNREIGGEGVAGTQYLTQSS
jgi:hypothetical protein